MKIHNLQEMRIMIIDYWKTWLLKITKFLKQMVRMSKNFHETKRI